MNIILIPGFWLDGDSWAEVSKPLREAGHTVRELTLPGLESRDTDRSNIGLRDHVDYVIATVDEIGEPVVLVGHSGGGAIAHAVADARPLSIARIVYVDSGPLAHGHVVNDELPVEHGEIPLPDWSVFEEPDLTDLTDELREHFRSIAIPQPARVASDKQVLSDPRRYDVPVTVICCEFTTEQLLRWMKAGEFDELEKVVDYELVDLPTGHWPQFTKPSELAHAILVAVDQ